MQVNILLNILPAKKLQEYDKYPLAHWSGLIYSIPENLLSMDTATIIDVNFLGLFPKSLLAVLRKYKQNLEKDRHPGFDELNYNLILHLSIGQS